MKKLILLIVSIVLITQSLTYAYYDIDDTKLSVAVDTLSQFGIINGYEDGSFKPYNYITRAEFAKIITATTAIENITYDENDTFSDVSDSHWAKDCIYMAKSVGIISGTTETTFSPSANITYEQAIKMIVAALGYTKEANNSGGYPDGYISVADKLGITDGLEYNQKDYATRWDIALMVRNALDAEYYILWIDNGEIQRELSDVTLYETHNLLLEMQSLDVDVSTTEEAYSDIGVG